MINAVPAPSRLRKGQCALAPRASFRRCGCVHVNSVHRFGARKVRARRAHHVPGLQPLRCSPLRCSPRARKVVQLPKLAAVPRDIECLDKNFIKGLGVHEKTVHAGLSSALRCGCVHVNFVHRARKFRAHRVRARKVRAHRVRARKVRARRAHHVPAHH